MSLWGPSRNFLRNTVSATEPLVVTTTATGRHYLRVTSLAEGRRNQGYRLLVEGLDGRDLQPVEFEIVPGVASVGERVQYSFTIVNNRVLDAPSFHYGIYLSTDPVIDASDDVLLREVAEAPLAGGASRVVGNKVTVPTGVNEGQLHYLGVIVDNRVPDEVDEFEENNNVALMPLQVRAACEVDSAEPNDARIDAVELIDHLEGDLTLCPGDVDWYVLDVTPSESYSIDAVFSAAEGDLDLFVYQPDLVLLASGETIGDDEQVAFTAPEGVDFVYLVAEPFGTTNITYQLFLVEE
jgi:hypothetical protein